MKINEKAKKIISSLVIATTITTSLPNMVLAKEESANNKEIRVYFNDEQISFDQQPVIVDGRTKVPFRAIFESMGTIVYYRQSDATILGLTRDGDVINHKIGTNKATLNGVEKTYDSVSEIINDRTLIPVRMVADLLSAEVEWKDKTKTVDIEKEIATNEYYKKIRGIMECSLDQNFNPEDFQRYLNYQFDHWDMEPKQVVLNVNMDLDKELIEVDGMGNIPGTHPESKPEDVETIKNTDSFLMLINRFNKLPDDYVPKDIISIDLDNKVFTAATRINATAGKYYTEMYNDAKKEGFALDAVYGLWDTTCSTYITPSDAFYLQQESYVYNLHPYGRFSELETGLAIELGGSWWDYTYQLQYAKEHNILPVSLSGEPGSQESFDLSYQEMLPTMEKYEILSNWLENNSYKYGYIIRYPKGKEHITRYYYIPWQLRYVGKDVAKIMHDENLCLEEYWAKYMNPSEYKTDLESTKQRVLKIK